MGYIINVFKCMVIDNATNDLIATSLLQDAGIQRQLQALELRTGVGNKLVAYIPHSPDTSVNLTHTELAYPFLARSLGQTITTGAGTGWKYVKDYTVVDGGTGSATVTLDDTPLAVADVFVNNASGAKVTGFTLTTDTLDFTSATPAVAVGDVLSITYQFATDAQTQTIVIDDSVFPKGAKVILETLEVDGNNAPLNTIQYELYNCVPDGNVTINTQSSPQAVTQQMNMKVVNIGNDSKIGEIRRIPVTAS